MFSRIIADIKAADDVVDTSGLVVILLVFLIATIVMSPVILPTYLIGKLIKRFA